MDEEAEESCDGSPGETSVRVRGAVKGNEDDVAWVYEHFAPMIIAQGRRRIPAAMRHVLDEWDLLNASWAAALGSLSTKPFEPRGDRFVPSFVRFLGSCATNVLINEQEKFLRRRSLPIDGSSSPSGHHPPDSAAGPHTNADRNEGVAALADALCSLPDTDQELFICIHVEGRSLRDTAKMAGVPYETLRDRNRALLSRLREILPGSLVDEFNAS